MNYAQVKVSFLHPLTLVTCGRRSGHQLILPASSLEPHPLGVSQSLGGSLFKSESPVERPTSSPVTAAPSTFSPGRHLPQRSVLHQAPPTPVTGLGLSWLPLKPPNRVC